MGVLEDKALAEQVDNVSEILAPVVYRALRSAPHRDPEPHTGWTASAQRKYIVPAEITNSAQHVLLTAAAGGFGPKLFPRCIPEHAAMVDGMERVIAKLVPADHRGSDKPGPLTETEMCGILSAFDRMPLCVDKTTGQVRGAARYNLMDKGRAFLLWGYATNRIISTDLSPGMFTVVSAMQQSNNKGKEVKDALQFFGLTSAVAFNTLQGHVWQAASHAAGRLAQAMEAGPADPGGPRLALPGGAAAWQIHWPSLFLHCCEVKQTLNALGRAGVEVAIQHRVASSQLLRHLFGGYSDHDPFMVVLVRHAMTARVRLKEKQPPSKAYDDKPAKRSKPSRQTASRHQPTTRGGGTTSGSELPHSKQTPVTSGSELTHSRQTPVKETSTWDSQASPQTDDKLAQETQNSQAVVIEQPDHGCHTASGAQGSPTGASMPASTHPTRVPCQCSGMCAVGGPMCPARLRWSSPHRHQGMPKFCCHPCPEGQTALLCELLVPGTWVLQSSAPESVLRPTCGGA